MCVLGLFISVIIFMSGCNSTSSVDDNVEELESSELEINEIVTVNDYEMYIYSTIKMLSKCYVEYEDVCLTEYVPNNDYYIVIQIVIIGYDNEEDDFTKDFFKLEDASGEEASTKWATETKTSDSIVVEIAYDVFASNYYNLYYQDLLMEENITFTLYSSDITY